MKCRRVQNELSEYIDGELHDPVIKFDKRIDGAAADLKIGKFNEGLFDDVIFTKRCAENLGEMCKRYVIISGSRDDGDLGNPLAVRLVNHIDICCAGKACTSLPTAPAPTSAAFPAWPT